LSLTIRMIELGDPKLNDQHCLILELVDEVPSLTYIRYMARKINRRAIL